jgi:hypothetical protein
LLQIYFIAPTTKVNVLEHYLTHLFFFTSEKVDVEGLLVPCIWGAARAGDHRIVDALAKAGADVNVVVWPERQGDTPLTAAANEGWVKPPHLASNT